MTAHYYNDHDPQVCAWLRELIAAGHLPEGDVDERSITDVDACDLGGYVGCHFFAGIGGWPYALRLAGWPDDRPVWTGSPPCQPFSPAGRQRARDDDRHLAPAFLGLVRACGPPMLFGEQVASASVVGRAGKPPRGAVAGAPEWAWLDDLQDGLEAAGYAVGAADIPAAGVGAPHIRQRLFFGAVRIGSAWPTLPGGVASEWPTPERVDDTAGARRIPERQRPEGEAWHKARLRGPQRGCDVERLADADEQGSSRRGIQRPEQGDGAGYGAAQQRPAGLCANGGLADADHAGPQGRGERGYSADKRAAGASGVAGGLADADGGEPGQAGAIQPGGQYGQQPQDGGAGRVAEPRREGRQKERKDGRGRGEGSGAQGLGERSGDGRACDRPGPPDGFWRDADWLYCRDGKWRPVGPGSQPLADGLPARVGRLRGYGNAIVPQVAGEFVKAFSEAALEQETAA